MNLLTLILIIVGIVGIIIFITVTIFRGGYGDVDKKTKYQYRRKNFFLTRAEHEFYDTLIEAVGHEYYIFPQVHLPTLIDHTIRGQDWRAAFAHINRKSVDFVLCDKAYISPKLAIELDDKSHERRDRFERDVEVERILHQAGVPLIRLENHGRFNPSELARKINSAFSAKI